jgi:hypothetical protein
MEEQGFRDIMVNRRQRDAARQCLLKPTRRGRYPSRDIPHWAGLTDCLAEGLERSIHEVQVPIIHYDTKKDL